VICGLRPVARGRVAESATPERLRPFPGAGTGRGHVSLLASGVLLRRATRKAEGAPSVAAFILFEEGRRRGWVAMLLATQHRKEAQSSPRKRKERQLSKRPYTLRGQDRRCLWPHSTRKWGSPTQPRSDKGAPGIEALGGTE